MNAKKLFLGAIVWSVGITIPLMYHALLMNAAIQEQNYSYSFHHMVKHFFDLPWITWPYLIAMVIVGGLLVKSGLKKEEQAT
jgi:hypothetical protein